MPPTSKDFLKRNEVGCECTNRLTICEKYTEPDYDSMCDHLMICPNCGHKPECHKEFRIDPKQRTHNKIKEPKLPKGGK